MAVRSRRGHDNCPARMQRLLHLDRGYSASSRVTNHSSTVSHPDLWRDPNARRSAPFSRPEFCTSAELPDGELLLLAFDNTIYRLVRR